MCTAVKKKQKCLPAFGQCFSALPAFLQNSRVLLQLNNTLGAIFSSSISCRHCRSLCIGNHMISSAIWNK